MKKVLMVLLVLVVLAGIGLAGFYIYNKVTGAKESALESVTNVLTKNKYNPVCKYNDPDLCKFINNWKVNKYYTATSESVVDESNTKMVIKADGDDKTQMINFEGDKETYNVIYIGDTTYTKDYSDNKWWKYTLATQESDNPSKDFDFDENEASTEDKTTYKKIGKEKIGKYDCFKYQVIDPVISDITEYLYFDDNDYQLRRIFTQMANGTSQSDFDYGKVSISEPSPTKEGSPYDAINSSNINQNATNQVQDSLESAVDGVNTENQLGTTEEEIQQMQKELESIAQ